ncbi:hypothetical protein G4G27_13180 [Sphingomonas sp. So64.6b]|uniref:hypothetical protein n=1 Tax=Sphingomonas sp. So64.6b TaxID=2997354 RepID=UPI0016022817|nr:hypothetical protein [Sphingomonas sp. So64.6b]QNA84840.1 hypothetical protein G4G27_13180 [Sphingomonas sp. So64.6b]
MALIVGCATSHPSDQPNPAAVSIVRGAPFASYGIAADRLHDARIDIESLNCRHNIGCRQFRLSLDHNGRGEMRFDRGGVPQVRYLILTPYDFRRLQIVLEPLRPGGTVPVASIERCPNCSPNTESTVISWQSDHSAVQRFSYRHDMSRMVEDIDGPILAAQNMLLGVLAPDILVSR